MVLSLTRFLGEESAREATGGTPQVVLCRFAAGGEACLTPFFAGGALKRGEEWGGVLYWRKEWGELGVSRARRSLRRVSRLLGKFG